MQKTADSLRILVGENKTPITLTDSAVNAVQDEASGNVGGALEEIGSQWEALVGSPADWTGEELLGIRDRLQQALENVEILMDCRPLDEFQG